ncbi:MFS transporter [Shewanella corallii]|uniref:MFS transporter n=1 Tax=Shewanella corallii TaxID=560080 RepID=A0ABT0NAY1_9GAMM|nr:MFS transporter [Shewanella corallii]MCL2915612.1 MFS transporter [Shewanella corallii]
MHRARSIAALVSCYFLFAILMNSVGTVILQSTLSFGVSKAQAASLEGFKDIPIALVSLLLASFIPRIGYKVALTTALLALSIVCVVVPSIPHFWMIKLLFAAIGSSFALVKVSVYSQVGELSDSKAAHSSLLSTIEGTFMLGVLSGYWLFPLFFGDAAQSFDWLNVYYLLGGMLLLTGGLVLFTPLPEPQCNKDGRVSGGLRESWMQMIRLAIEPLVLVFVFCTFLYVLIEQAVGTWLPTFNHEYLGLPLSVSVQLTSVFAASLALGRLAAGLLLKWIPWFSLLTGCVLLMALLVLLALSFEPSVSGSVTGLTDIPAAAWVMPLIGLVMAPLYPVLNSLILSSREKSQHASMTGLIVVFSALGGTTGSYITGWLFHHFGGQQAFLLTIVPMIILLFCLIGFRRLTAPATNLLQGS